MIKTWSYAHPTRVLWGESWSEELSALTAELASGPIGIITGRNAAREAGYLKALATQFGGREWHLFDHVEPEPAHSTVMAAAAFVEQHGVRCLVALGGGSVIDAAKAAACVAYAEIPDITPYMDRERAFSAKQIPLVAMPMTAGTGSEVTPFSVLTNETTGAKKSLPSPYFYPDVALVNPAYLATVPTKVAGDVGLDALAHAYEALWSTNANPVSDALGFQAIKLITDSFLAHYDDPSNAIAAAAMSKGAVIAGMAFSNTLTAGCHALSYPIGQLFGLTHGASCAMTLHLIAEVNAPAVAAKFADLAAYLGLADGEEVPASIARLRQCVATIPTLRELGAGPGDLRKIAQGAFQPLLQNNPVELTEDRIVELLTPEIA